jgi:HEAT repeat protein
VREECLDPLIRGLSSPAPSVRAEAAATLRLMGADAERALLALNEMTKDRDKSLRQIATEAMAEIRGLKNHPDSKAMPVPPAEIRK